MKEKIIRTIDERIVDIMRDEPKDMNSRIEELVYLKKKIVEDIDEV